MTAKAKVTVTANAEDAEAAAKARAAAVNAEAAANVVEAMSMEEVRTSAAALGSPSRGFAELRA